MLKEILRGFRKKWVRVKLYVNRTSNYIQLLNAGMILFLFLSKLKEVGIIHLQIERYFYIIVIIGIIFMIIIGWMEVKLFKGYSEEMRFAFELDPFHVEMRDKLNEIYKILKEKNDKRN